MKRELRAFDDVIQSVHMNKELVLDGVDEREENSFTYSHKSKIESLDLISWRGLGVKIVKKGRDGTRSLTYSSCVLQSSMQIIQTTIVSSRISTFSQLSSRSPNPPFLCIQVQKCKNPFSFSPFPPETRAKISFSPDLLLATAFIFSAPGVFDGIDELLFPRKGIWSAHRQ